MAIMITCYGGINEIGGCKILVEDGDVQVFLDFGKSFGRYSDYFDGVFVRERTTRGLLDAMALGLIPPIVLSHAHLDHSGDLDFVRPEVPVFSSRMTAFIAKAMQDSGKPGASGVVYANPHTVKENGLLAADKSKGYVWRQWGFL